METNAQYFDCLCRTCMNNVEASSHDGTTIPQKQWLSIFDVFEECGALRIAELLSEAVPQIVVQPSDELPKKICTECLQRLLSVHRFQQMCVQSDKEMHELLSKEQTVLKTPVLEEAIKGETETNDAETQPLKDLDWSSTLQNLQQPSMQEPLAEVTVQAIEQEAAQSSAADHFQDNSQLLEYCNDKGEFEEFIKNEPIEDDEANSDYSDGDTMVSTISVTKDEVLPMEFEHQQVNDAVLGEQRTTYAEDKPYECPYCPLRFCSKQNASLHKTIHEGIKPHKCGICGKNFRVKSNLTKHARIHSTKKPHNCDQCEKRFAQMEELKTHMRTHTGEKPYKCKYCERGFAECSTLNNHLRRHLGKNIYRCKFCPLAFPLKSDMVLHLTSHKNENPDVRERNLKALQEEEDKLVLKFSKEKSKRQTQEQQQQKLSDKEIKQPSTETKRHKCIICGKEFNRRSSLIIHKLIHSEEKPHKCDLCEKRFAQMEQLKNHTRTHTGEKPYKCKYCERAFGSRSILSNHLHRHLGKNFHRCNLCPLAFPSSAERRLHLISHKNEDPETREQNLKALQEEEAKLVLKFSKEKSKGQSTAEQKLSNKDIEQPSTDIVAEQYTTHDKDKPYECPYCPLRFTSKGSATQHKTIHEGIKPHKCSICEKTFRLKCALIMHKRVHSNEKPHKCDQCEKQFIHMQDLKIHIRKHTGEKPYKCKYCERVFATHYILTYHLRSHLGDNIHRCKFCSLAFRSNAEMRLHFTSHKNEDPEVRERNLKALQEEEAKLKLKFSKEISKGQSTEEQQQEKLSDKDIEQPSRDVLGEQRPTYAEDKPYECPYCPLRFSSKRNASRHKAVVHEGAPKQYECDICGKKCRHQSALKSHKLIHSKEKPYKCDFCEKRFARMVEQKVHTRTHTGEKPFKCKYCERGFADCSILSNHLRRHLGKNFHRCKLCPLAFPSSAAKRLHLISHKNEDPKVRERNMKALQEEEAKLVLKFTKDKIKGESTEEQQQQKLSNKEIEQPPTERGELEEFIKEERAH